MKIGQVSSFYHETGRGELRTVMGWRVGIVRAMPTRGSRKNWVQLELQAERWGFDHATQKWFSKPKTRVWVHGSCVNRLGDVRYHGLSDVQVVRERQEKKAADIAAAKVTSKTAVTPTPIRKPRKPGSSPKATRKRKASG